MALSAGTALGAALAVPLLGAFAPPARAAVIPGLAPARHVVIVGISGLTWNDVSREATGELWRLAAAGSVGALVDYAQEPLACPADGWLTLNSAARAQGPRPCASLPAVTAAGTGATVAAMPRIIQDNQRFHESPAWGLLGTLAGCATAVGPGAALALASPAGAVASYLPAAGDLSAAVLARCPLTVIDLGQVAAGERGQVSAADRQLARIAAELPRGTLLLVTAPGAAASAGQAPAGPPHLMSVLVDGPGYATGRLDSASTRRPGIVTLTDLTPTVAGWLGAPVPGGTVGARITRADRGGLEPAVTGLTARDRAEQVWIATHGWFFVGYGAAGALAFGLAVLLSRGSGRERQRRRARWLRVAGTVAAAVPLASYLANVAPWWYWAHPAWWLYGMTLGWTLVVAAAALAGPWRRDALGPFGAICAATALLLAVDVMAGSRLQLNAPFGLSLLVSGRFYGIGNNALGVYCVSVLVAAAWLASITDPQVPLASREAPAAVRPCGPHGQDGIDRVAHRRASSDRVGHTANADMAVGAAGPERGAGLTGGPANLGAPRANRELEAKGKTRAGREPEVNAGLEAGTGPEAGAGLNAGAGPQADTGLEAGTGLKAGAGPQADTGPEAGTGLEVGAGPEAGAGLEAGAGPEVGTGLEAGAGSEVGTGLEAGTGPEAGTGLEAGTGPEAGGEPAVGSGTWRWRRALAGSPDVHNSPSIIRSIINFIILRRAVVVVGGAGGVAVVASGWPGFGAKVGGTIALVPCLVLLAAWLGGARVRGRWAVPVAVSGLALFLVFAVASYLLPGAGLSDMGTFAGDLLRGRAGDLLQRKFSANVGSLTLNVFGWLIPVAALLAAAALWRPAALRLRTLACAFASLPLLRGLAWLAWLVLVIGWFADDSGVIVPAAALPFAVPLVIAMAASANS